MANETSIVNTAGNTSVNSSAVGNSSNGNSNPNCDDEVEQSEKDCCCKTYTLIFKFH